MFDSSEKIDPKWAWDTYEPSAKRPWIAELVGHFYRRAAFGATQAELEAGLRLSPEQLVDACLTTSPKQAEFDKGTVPLAETLARANNAAGLSAWWLHRMLHSPTPLQEKMTLFWHNHFATSNAKIQSVRLMHGQYELMRKYALGNFGDLLQEMSKDPAMVIWLDTKGSKKGNPNENYARELMELFSLGIGHYSERDIREAARAFTGFDVTGTEVVYREADHDAGDKEVLGQKGRFKGPDIVRICLEQQAAPEFIARKLYRFFVSETLAPSAELIAPLATQLRKNGFLISDVVRTILRSNLFFSPLVYRTSIKSPIDFVLGMVRALEAKVGTSVLATILSGLGQNLFNPPNVKGWDGGQAWLNGQTLLFRQNLALALTSTEDPRFGSRADPVQLLRKYDKKTDEQAIDFFLGLFLQNVVAKESRAKLIDYCAKARTQSRPIYWTESDAADHRVRSLCHLVLTLPEYQLD